MILHNEVQKMFEADYLNAFQMLEQKIHMVLSTYSNVERGSGHYSQITTALYEHARKTVLDYLHLDKNEYVTVFCSPVWAERLIQSLSTDHYYCLSSQEISLPVGLRVLALRRKDLPKGIPSQMGGGTIKLVSANSLVLADVPERFETGTPPVINAIAFAISLNIIEKFKSNPFQLNDDLKDSSTPDDILYSDSFIDLFGKELLVMLRDTMIGKHVILPTRNGDQSFVNLDNAASTPSFQPVWDSVSKVWHQPKVVQKKVVEEVKHLCSQFFNAPQNEYEVIFCANTTEAINIAARNFLQNKENDTIQVVLNTRLEHHSNDLPWRFSRKTKLIRLNVDNNGFLDLSDLKKLLKAYNKTHEYGKQRIGLVAVNGASNVTGTFSDIQTIAQLVHKYGAQILVDGAQLVAHRKIDLLASGIDFLAFSGHKMYAPFGSGALIARKNLLNFRKDELVKIMLSGEENIIGITAIGKAINLIQRVGWGALQDEETQITKYALKAFSKLNNIKVFGLTNTERSEFAQKGSTISFKVTRVPHNLVASELAEIGGIGVRTGCFCAHLMVKQLMGITPFRGKVAEIFLTLFPSIDTRTLPGIVRISLGIENTTEDIDRFIETMQTIIAAPRTNFVKFTAYMNNGMLDKSYTKEKATIENMIKNRITQVFD